MKPTKLDQTKCTVCKICLSQCNSDYLIFDKNSNKVLLSKAECIECGHCIAVCPEGALSVNGKIPEKLTEIPQHGKMLGILKARRSMRRYLKEDVKDNELAALAEFARFAPTGSNCEATRILFVKDKTTREKVTKELMKFYVSLNRITSFFLVKIIASIFVPKKKLNYLKESLEKMISRYKQGKDPLFYNSPVIIFIYMKKGASSTPKDDACYALYNMVLGAESMGLATCINQLAVISFNRKKRKIRKILGLTKKDKIYASSSLGYPAFEYKRTVFRKDAKCKII